jgi:GNAT superfamily N-acetyltransferase
MPTAKPEIVRITEDQIDIAAGILARAFHSDPPMIYAIPDAAERARILPPLMRTFVTYACMFGEPLTTAGKPEGVALWLPLEEFDTPERDRQAGTDRIPEVLGAGNFARLMYFVSVAERFHKTTAPEPHLYLQFLGVEPQRQGNGLGSALIRPMVERADAHGMRCYLETFQPRNVPLYKKHGFEIAIEEVEPNSGVRGWAFLRKPRK